MQDSKLNIVLLGANYYGQMASSQRVHNLFYPLVKAHKISLYNIVSCRQDVSLVNNTDVEVVSLIQKNRVANFLSYIHLSRRMLKQWYNKEAKNIIYHYGYPAIDSYPILLVAQRLGYKIVFDIVENVYAYPTKNISIALRFKNISKRYFATRMSTLGDICFGISDNLVAICKELTKEQIPVRLLPISADVEKVYSYKKDAKKKNEITIFYGGSFGQKDGISYLVDGFAKAWQQDKRLKLYLTGKIAKESAGELEQYIMQSDAKEAICYLGCLPTEVYYERMANSDILCMLRVNSVFANSGFPFKLGEYLASGNAVIATRTSDMEKYLTHKQNAYLIQPEDSALIAEAILELASDAVLRKKIGAAGQSVAKENFDAPNVSEYLYTNILNIWR